MEARTIDIPGHTLAYKHWHASRKPLLLALHGWMDNAATFDHLAPLLEHYQVVAVDLPGHGYSTHKPVGTRYHLLDAVVELIEIADALGAQRFALLGHSLGGAIFTLLAAVAPERVISLGLIDALGPISTPADATLEACRKGVLYTEKLKDTRQPSYSTIENAIEARGRSSFLPKKGMENIVHRGIKEEDGRWVWRHDVRIKSPSLIRMTESQVNSFLVAIECPVCLIKPEKGLEVAKELMEKRVGAVKKIEVASCPGGHYPHLEHSVKAAEILNNFYKKTIDPVAQKG